MAFICTAVHPLEDQALKKNRAHHNKRGSKAGTTGCYKQRWSSAGRSAMAWNCGHIDPGATIDPELQALHEKSHLYRRLIL